MKTLKLIGQAKARLLTKAAVTLVTTINLKQTDDLKSLFEGATVEFKSPDGSIKGVIQENRVLVDVTQDQVIEGIKAISPSTEALPLVDQVSNLKRVIEGYENFVSAVKDASSNVDSILKQATAKKIKTVSQALDIVKDNGIFLNKEEPPAVEQQGQANTPKDKPELEPKDKPEVRASVKRFKGRRIFNQ